MYKILTIVGARPHFIKATMVSQAIAAAKKLEEVIIHTGQHYDYQLSQSFFEELQLPRPTYNLNVGSSPHIQQMGNILLRLDKIFEDEKPDLVIVYGDTNSTAAGAIAAAKNNIPLAHIEAGLREFDKTIPEEVNKLLTDAVTDLYFSPTATGVKNLKKAGIKKNVYNVGDVGIDLVHHNIKRIEANKKLLKAYSLKPNAYYFMTCHRAANTDSKKNLKKILSVFENLDLPLVFSIHPRTRQAIEKYKLTKYLERENLILLEPIGFWDTQTFIRHAKMVLTDSGGIIKEAYFHKVPAIILDKQTEWVESVEEGWNHVAGPKKKKILKILHNFERPKFHSNCLGDGNASKKIIKIIIEYLDVKR